MVDRVVAGCARASFLRLFDEWTLLPVYKTLALERVNTDELWGGSSELTRARGRKDPFTIFLVFFFLIALLRMKCRDEDKNAREKCFFFFSFLSEKWKAGLLLYQLNCVYIIHRKISLKKINEIITAECARKVKVRFLEKNAARVYSLMCSPNITILALWDAEYYYL